LPLVEKVHHDYGWHRENYDQEEIKYFCYLLRATEFLERIRKSFAAYSEATAKALSYETSHNTLTL